MMTMTVELDMQYHSHLEILESISLLEIIYLFGDIYFGQSVEDSYDCCRNCVRISWIETNFSSICIEHCNMFNTLKMLIVLRKMGEYLGESAWGV